MYHLRLLNVATVILVLATNQAIAENAVEESRLGIQQALQESRGERPPQKKSVIISTAQSISELQVSKKRLGRVEGAILHLQAVRPEPAGHN